MSFMELEMIDKGTLYSCECGKCGATLYSHEWADGDYNDRRAAMQAGTLRCDWCNGTADAETFRRCKGQYYAARYSAPGFLDCTDWHYDTNRRELARLVRAMYGGA